MNKASERLSAFRALLRHIDHPERLRYNPLAEWQFRVGGDPSNAAARVKRLVEQLLDDLPMRQREIVLRCDLKGEPHAEVISSLAVSERHFYRERRSAFEFVGSSLARAAQRAIPIVFDAKEDAVGLQLTFADATHQVGDIAGAIRTLLDASADVVDNATRSRLECRIAELCCEAGKLDDARRHIGIARSIVSGREDDKERGEARVDAVEAMVAWSSGDSALGARRAECATALLRKTLWNGAAAVNAEAFALASLVLNDREIALGRWESARRLALEAHRALWVSESRRSALMIRVQSAAAEAYMLDATHLADAACEYERLYREAVSRGFMLEAMRIGWPLAQFHRFADSPLSTVAKLRGMLPLARHVLPVEARAEMCLGLASAYLACRQPDRAQSMISEARTYAPPGGLSYALSYVVAADTCFFEREFGQALRLSRLGLEAMRRLGRQTFMGSALRIQADATFALGDFDGAKVLIGEALSYLDGGGRTGHPFVIARAHRTAARITGDGAHWRIASEVLATLRKSAGAIPLR